MWFVKSKRAQTSDDDETWIAGGVAPTLNAFDMGDTRATVIILMREREGKSGGGKGLLLTDKAAFTLSTSNFHILYMSDKNTQAVAFDTFNQTVSDTNQTIKAHSANNENIGTVFESSVVRRLTPTECERLQGFPDGWTDGQADSHRYKQMGNAVAVPVVEWIINRIIK
jgi:site-specific DNA-cytosine methylase